MKNKLFHSKVYLTIAEKTRELLNSQKDFLSKSTINSPRAVGDALQDILAENFDQILGEHCNEYSSSFARRAMADLAFTDRNGCYYVVDVKTHREDTKFNMPNLTSVNRLARFYEDDANYFALLLLKYSVNSTSVLVNRVDFIPIEYLDWDCLTLGALGWGQIQIANSNNVVINPKNTRKKWMLDLCDNLFDFYPKEIGKIQKRIDYFTKVREFWEQK